MQNSARFFENRECQYFPCHKGMEDRAFNCLFCYCPLNHMEHCPGNPVFRTKADGRVIKDCTNCTFPHEPEHYDTILQFLREK